MTQIRGPCAKRKDMAPWRSPPEQIQGYGVQRWGRHIGLGVAGEDGYLFCVILSQKNTHLCALLPMWSQATPRSISHLPPQPGSDQTSPGAHSASLNHLRQSHLRCLRKQTPALASPALVLPPSTLGLTSQPRGSSGELCQAVRGRHVCTVSAEA